MFYSATYLSPLGKITLASQNYQLVALWIEGQQHFGSIVADKVIVKQNLPVFNLTKRWLDHYFAGKKMTIEQLPLGPKGTPFREKVWDLLCKIPYGQVVTYGDIARQIALQYNLPKMSSQAVGGAVGHNPISIIIPCHRVIGANGNLTGYAGGIDKKIKLLQIEGIDTSNLVIPKKGVAG